jgi:hypothetical protein
MPHRRRFWPAIIRCVLCEVVTRGRFAVTSHAQLENVFLRKPLALSFAKTRSGRNRHLASASSRKLTGCQNRRSIRITALRESFEHAGDGSRLTLPVLGGPGASDVSACVRE